MKLVITRHRRGLRAAVSSCGDRRGIVASGGSIATRADDQILSIDPRVFHEVEVQRGICNSLLQHARS
jgi:hypothetical protein